MPLIFIAILASLIALFWDWFNTNVIVIGTIATSLAFFAAIWTAFEARKSAKAGFLAVKAAEKSLDESRKNFRKEAFNQRFSLLLEQHNNYLNKVNEYLRSADGWDFLSKVFKEDVHIDAFNMLKGHFVLSPYMRVLYHLLKFIEDDYFGDKDDVVGMKKYSSLVRSLISNDALFLIAINASITFEYNKKTQYKKYQHLLHRFDFFEHADFFLIHDQVNASKFIESDPPFYSLESDIKDIFYRYCLVGEYEVLNSYKPSVPMSTILSYIYLSPRNKEVEDYFSRVKDKVKILFENGINKKSYHEIFEEKFLYEYVNTYVITKPLIKTIYVDEVEKGELLTSECIKCIIRGIKNNRLNKLGSPDFRAYRISKDKSHISFHSLFESLYDRVVEYLTEINRKNYIFLMKDNIPLNATVAALKYFENELKTQKSI
ncbi:putative phage abortive infection protein [Pectobacterium zantedeschiae]|uniref:putative phage abortive infection protein n=1 Tax=Pectobacterium zantedeschiae TaxID=2034769 RepID=UPI00101DC2BC|nr:putative phage abortive infection protein [Pectobacterium zantedeschiae]RYC47233.1 hypothetical protein DEH81_02290 [Pectobacterium zantedeschiae]